MYLVTYHWLRVCGLTTVWPSCVKWNDSLPITARRAAVCTFLARLLLKPCRCPLTRLINKTPLAWRLQSTGYVLFTPWILIYSLDIVAYKKKGGFEISPSGNNNSVRRHLVEKYMNLSSVCSSFSSLIHSLAEHVVCSDVGVCALSRCWKLLEQCLLTHCRPLHVYTDEQQQSLSKRCPQRALVQTVILRVHNDLLVSHKQNL